MSAFILCLCYSVHKIHISELILNGKQTNEPNPSRWKKTEAETFHTNDTIVFIKKRLWLPNVMAEH
jgi:hypothetical protein